MSKCAMCGMNAVINRQDNASRTIYNCPHCGVFVTSDVVEKEVESQKSKLAAYLMHRNLSGNNEIIMISLENVSKDKGYVHMTVQQIVKEFPGSLLKRFDLALENLVNKSEYPGYEIKIESLHMGPLFYLDKVNFDSMSYAITVLEKKGLIIVNHYGASSSFLPCGIVVTPEGWEKAAYEEADKNSRDNAFVFITQGTEYTENYFSSAVKACKRSGYEVISAEAFGETSLIGHKQIATILGSRFVICDVSDASPCAYFISGMTRALNRTLILTCRIKDKKKLKFDTEHNSILFWDDSSDLSEMLDYAIRSMIF